VRSIAAPEFRRKFAKPKIAVQTKGMDYVHGAPRVRPRQAPRLLARRTPLTGPVDTLESHLPAVILLAFAAVAGIQMMLQG
jgi:hypothetical protein